MLYMAILALSKTPLLLPNPATRTRQACWSEECLLRTKSTPHQQNKYSLEAVSNHLSIYFLCLIEQNIISWLKWTIPLKI